jgi:hypothetical protein
MTTTAHPELEGLDRYKFGWADSDVAGAAARRGLSEEVVRDISAKKNEPEWMLDLRLKGLKLFRRKPMPDWGADLTGIDFENIKYFVRSTEKQAASWDDLPADIKSTYDKLGIPQAEKQRLIAGRPGPTRPSSLWVPEASGSAARNEGANWALGRRQDPVQVTDVQEPPHLRRRRQQRQAASRFPRPVSRRDQDADPGGADEGDTRHVDGQMDVSAADRRHEKAPDGWRSGDVDFPVEDDGS